MRASDSSARRSHPLDLARLAALPILVAALLLAAPASAATPNLFTSFPEGGKAGSGAGQLRDPAAIATNPVNGDVYVAESGDIFNGGNSRIDEFTAWGEFVRAWGWGVVASGPDNDPHNEVQEVSLSGGTSGGSFRLEYWKMVNPYSDDISRRQTTSEIPHTATAAQVREALEGMGSLKPGDVDVSGPAGGPWTIEFTGSYADTDIAPLVVTGSTLVGGEASVATLQGGAAFEVCDPAAGDVCREGQRAGGSPGEIVEAHGLAFDSSGDLYVYEGEKDFLKSLRVQKFSADGKFLTMFGGEVDKTSGADVCSKADSEGGDECGAGVPGSDPAHFLNALSSSAGVGGNIVVGDGTVYVGDEERIQKFDSAGAYLGSIPLPAAGRTQALAYDAASGDLYFAFQQNFTNEVPEKPNVYKLDPETGKVLGELPVAFPRSMATNPAGDLYLIAEGRHPTTEEVIEFDPAGKAAITIGEGFDSVAIVETLPFKRADLAVDSACGTVGVYVANPDQNQIAAFGPTPNPVLCPPPVRPPAITGQYAVSVGSEAAVVRAAINPRFWEDTRYYVQYGTSECKLGGCAEQPLSPGLTLAGAGVSANLTTQGVTLSGLSPRTTYHYRFVAQSSGGGPVYGVGEEEAEATFTTRPAPSAPNASCPNQARRTGASAALPDCRAYEMVSPLDKGGGNPIGRSENVLDQSDPQGGRLTFTSYRAFGGAEGATFVTQYMASRDPGEGWSSKGISPPSGASFVSLNHTLENELHYFSPDLCSGWLVHFSDPPLSASAPEGFANLYRRGTCGEAPPAYTALINGEVQNSSSKSFWPELMGVSADGTHAVFAANGKLTEDASNVAEVRQLYEDNEGSLQLVSVLPNRKASELNSVVGSATREVGGGNGKNLASTVARAVSADGSRIYWTQLASSASYGGGKIFVRVEGSETRKVSATVSEEEAQFWTASESGSVAFFTVGGIQGGDGKLYEYDLEGESSSLIAGEVRGVVGASADGSRLYFVSREVLAGGAKAGAPNLYLDEGGAFTLVATLAAVDASTNIPSALNAAPNERLSRLSEDGRQLVFMSSSGALSEETAGYDNTDVQSGEADAEVYFYDASSGSLHCVSCDPTGARPAGHQIARGITGEDDLWVAAQIPGWTSQFYASRVLSDSGNRLFFESYDRLAPGDANGVQDVYEWETAGTGDCGESSSAYSPTLGGCVSLISSGTSPQGSSFIDAGAGGADVFFSTEASLLAKDPGQVDIYDARAQGGFAEAVAARECSGEACSGAGVAPSVAAPGSASYLGEGNLAGGGKPRSRRCAKGKRTAKREGRAGCTKAKKRGAHRRRSPRPAKGRAAR